MAKQSKSFRLSPDTVCFLQEYAADHQISITQAMEKIIQEYKSKYEFKKEMEEIVSEIFEKENRKTFTRIRLASSTADKNIQILLEMMNTLLVVVGASEHAYTSRLSKTKTWEQCENLVKMRIAEFKQKKDNKRGE